jgi:hypothetical protein
MLFSAGMNGRRMFCTDALIDMVVHPVLSAPEGIAAHNFHFVYANELVAEFLCQNRASALPCAHRVALFLRKLQPAGVFLGYSL